MLDFFRQITWTGLAEFIFEAIVLLSGFALFKAVCRSSTRIVALSGFVLAWIAAALVADPVWRLLPIYAGICWIGAFTMAWYGRLAAEAYLAPDVLDVSDKWSRWFLVAPLGAGLACIGLLALGATLGAHGVFGISLWQGPEFALEDLEHVDYPSLVHLFVFRVMLSMAWDCAIVAIVIAIILLPVLGMTSLVRRARTGEWT